MKISGAAIVALNRRYGLGSSIFDLCRCQPSSVLLENLIYIQYAFRYIMYMK